MRNFKSSGTTEAADALGELNLDGDDLDEEYDFMDDADNGAEARQSRANKSKAKYMNLLQDISDRTKSHITIELDDLDTVCARQAINDLLLISGSTKNL